MSDYILSCESTIDCPRSFFKECDIRWVPFHYTLDGRSYLDDCYSSVKPEEFFGKMKEGHQPTTSQVSAGEYIELWEPLLREHKNVLHLTLSSGVSGTYNSARVAAEQLRTTYPDVRVCVVDSLSASAGYGLLMRCLVDFRDAGMEFNDACTWAEEHRLNVNNWFFVSDLEYLKRGGRIPTSNSTSANALKTHHFFSMNSEGRLVVSGKVRTNKKAIAELVRYFCAHAEGGTAYAGKVAIAHSQCRAMADAVAAGIEEICPQLESGIFISDIGTVIGAHTGPGAIWLAFMGDRREE